MSRLIETLNSIRLPTKHKLRFNPITPNISQGIKHRLTSLIFLAAATFATPFITQKVSAGPPPGPYVIWGRITDKLTGNPIPEGERFIFYNMQQTPVDTFSIIGTDGLYSAKIPSNRVADGDTLHLYWDHNGLRACYYDSPGGLTLDYVLCGDCFADSTNFQASDMTVGVEEGQLPPPPLRISVYPNPFNPIVNLRFNLQKPTRINAEVYDASGRLIKTIYNGQTLGRGITTISWDGRDNDGNPLSSGVYFLRVRAGELSNTKKMVLLK